MAYAKTFTLHYSSDGITSSSTLLDGYVEQSTLFSAPVQLDKVDRYMIVVNIPSTGTPVGTLTVQECIDNLGSDVFMVPNGNLKNWVTVSTTAVSGNTNLVFNNNSSNSTWVRIEYVPTSGNATITAKFARKTIGIW
jgi:hypothetical protein